ncbi:TetR/AcrR family transcriptional regulator [Saccharothrix deserti]|uniref:TetR/AcrR family transcriptional regulator n=1 Tax=Saccharothrix deserti TaxID=2593674 RepID=UPI001EE42BB9|nr:TetR family transcriptional regulator [Saccharothrix deserti]
MVESTARYGKEHKEATRQRIVETAGRRFEQDGIDGSGVATLMSDAGLTNGAFYAHFASKDDLVATVVADQLRTQAARYSTLTPGLAGLEEFVREYLSPEHRPAPCRTRSSPTRSSSRASGTPSRSWPERHA